MTMLNREFICNLIVINIDVHPQITGNDCWNRDNETMIDSAQITGKELMELCDTKLTSYPRP